METNEESNGKNRLEQLSFPTESNIDKLAAHQVGTCGEKHFSGAEPPVVICAECAKELAMMAVGLTIEETIKRYPILRLSKEKIYEQAEEFWNNETKGENKNG